MLTPVGTGVPRYSYPIGDTPAVCLTQDIPPSFHGRARARTTKRGKTKGKKKEGEKENDRQDDDSHNDQKDPISILLLGCGDLRKILFTINHDSKPVDSRPLGARLQWLTGK